MKRKFATLVGTARTRLIMFALLAVLVGLPIAAHAQSTSTFSTKGSVTMVRGYQETSSPSSVVLMTIPTLGVVFVDCLNGLSRISFFPSVSGSLWFTHQGATGFVSGGGGTQLSNQPTDDVITAIFATTTKTLTWSSPGIRRRRASTPAKRQYNPKPHDDASKRLADRASPFFFSSIQSRLARLEFVRASRKPD